MSNVKTSSQHGCREFHFVCVVYCWLADGNLLYVGPLTLATQHGSLTVSVSTSRRLIARSILTSRRYLQVRNCVCVGVGVGMGVCLWWDFVGTDGTNKTGVYLVCAEAPNVSLSMNC